MNAGERKEDLIEELGDLMYSRLLQDVFGEKVAGRFSEREQRSKGPSMLDRAKGAYMDYQQRQQILNNIQNQQPSQPQQQGGYQPIP